MATESPTEEYINGPFYEVAEAAEKVAAAGGLTFQKFSCTKCSARLTMSEPNKFYKQGTCDQCGALTDIEADGCNFMVIQTLEEGSINETSGD